MDMAEGGHDKTEDQEFEAIRALVPRLIDKLVPEEISDKLFSQKIITKDVYNSSFDRTLLLKERTRVLVGCVLDAVEENKSVFNTFCLILEESKKPSIRELGKKLKDNLKKFEAKNEPQPLDTPVSSHFLQLKQDLQFFQKSLLQSDENIDPKYLLIKEAISKFVCQSLESGEQKESLHAKLEELCFVDIMVPQKLHDWCFLNLDSQAKDPVSQSAGYKTATNDPSPLFVKDNVYHALLLANIASVIGSRVNHSFFTKNLHAFDEVSISTEDSKADNKDLKRYIIARKGKIFFVAFCGEPNLLFWQHNYSSLDEGICSQKNRIPTRFFVEYLGKEDGHQIIFTGFSFGGSLAMAVHAELWSQSCLRINDLKANVACIGFGVPLFSLSIVKQIAEDCPDIIDNTHLFYIQNDVFPCVLQCVDFPKPKEKRKKSSRKNELYAGTISGDIIESLSRLQTIHSQQSVKGSESKDCLDALKVALEAAIPPTEVEVTIFGSVYYIFMVNEKYHISKKANQDQLQFLNARLSIDSLKVDLFKKHSVQKYQSLLGESYLNSTDHSFGVKYIYPKHKLNPAQFEYVKPRVSRALFFRHADEIAIVLEGQNLWFCHKIQIGAREEARILEIDADGQDTTMRTINFCYIPKGEDDLLIDIGSENVTITLFSHFCNPVRKRNVEAKKMVDYAISFRQRQLARLTPTEVIRLSLVSAILERPSIKSQSTSRPSKRFETIRQFLEDATRIVPVESICHAIENESEENAWKCAEALINSEFEPQPSLLFMNSLINAHLRLTTGIRPEVLQRVQAKAIHTVWDGRFYQELRTNIRVDAASDDKVVVTAENRLHDFNLYRIPRLMVGNPQQQEPLYSEVVGERKHSIEIHKDPQKHHDNTQSSKQNVIVTKLQSMSGSLSRQFTSKKCTKTICGLNISELYCLKNNGSSTSLKPPIEFLKHAKSRLQALQMQAQDELSSLKSDDDTEDTQNSRWEHHNETMIGIINDVMSQEVAICLSLLGAFMERQMKVPFVNSPEQTAHILQTTQSSSAIGVWTLFSLNMINMQSLLESNHLIIEVEKYVQGIIGQRQFSITDDHGRYAGKLQFLMVGMGQTVSCNTQYISYSLERQLTELCKTYEISAGDRVSVIVRNWNKTFSKSILFHVMVEFRPLLARWLLWSLNIHKLREELASNTTVGIVGLSNSGKSCLVKGLFRQSAISGTTRLQRTTVPFLYNLEGAVDGLSIADFPGVDDKDKTVVGISKILLRLSQIVILVIDYKRISTQSAVNWIKTLDNSGIPVLLCLTHADKFYANECIGKYGKDCSEKLAKRIIGKEIEDIKSILPTCPNRTTFFSSFCQDADSFLNCDKGRRNLSKLGISLQSDVGKWLIGILKELQQNDIAKRLDKFFSDNVNEPQQECLKEEKIPVPLELKESSIEIPKLLRSVNHIFWETALAIKRSGNEYQYLKWEEYGLKLVIPPEALEAEVVYTIAIKAVSIEGYSLPYESEIVSAFYWVYSSHRFLKPVDLVIQHCARLEDKESVSRMGFVTAPCNKDLPYKFVRKEGVFELQSRQGSFSTKHFSFFAIIRDYLFFGLESPSSNQNHTYYVFKVFGKKLSSQLQAWHFDFFFVKDIEAFITAINEKCAKAGWIEDVPWTSFDFEEGYKTIDVQMSDVSQFSNWNIKKKVASKIEKSHIDRSEMNTTQQRCRIAFQWKGRGTPSHINYSVTLKGIAGSPVINLTVPFESEDAESDMSRGVPVVPNQDIPPIHIDIQNNPVINVTTDTQS